MSAVHDIHAEKLFGKFSLLSAEGNTGLISEYNQKHLLKKSHRLFTVIENKPHHTVVDLL